MLKLSIAEVYGLCKTCHSNRNKRPFSRECMRRTLLTSKDCNYTGNRFQIFTRPSPHLKWHSLRYLDFRCRYKVVGFCRFGHIYIYIQTRVKNIFQIGMAVPKTTQARYMDGSVQATQRSSLHKQPHPYIYVPYVHDTCWAIVKILLPKYIHFSCWWLIERGGARLSRNSSMWLMDNTYLSDHHLWTTQIFTIENSGIQC